MRTAFVLVSHGSRSAASKREVVKLARLVKKKGRFSAVEPAFLGLNRPGVPAAIRSCVEKGFSDIVILPHFLASGNHVRKDLPRLVKEAAARHPRTRFYLAPHPGAREELAGVFVALAGKAARARAGQSPRRPRRPCRGTPRMAKVGHAEARPRGETR